MTKILVVESEEQLCTAISAYLESQGAETLSMATAQEAVSALDDSQVDLVVLDLTPCDDRSLDLLKHIRKSPSLEDLPVIVVSAWEVEPASYDYLEPGDLITKPFDMRILDWTIRELLAIPQDQQSDLTKEPN